MRSVTFYCIAFFICTCSLAQEIKGIVVDLGNRSIAGVNVMIKGTPNGTVTNSDGHFKINLQPGKFTAQQSLLKENIQSCSDLLDQGVVISSPANRIIVYKLDRAFDIIATHERRHLEQARELKQLMKPKI